LSSGLADGDRDPIAVASGGHTAHRQEVKRRSDPGPISSSTPSPASGRRYAGAEVLADDDREEFVAARSGSGAGTTMPEEVIREVPSLGGHRVGDSGRHRIPAEGGANGLDGSAGETLMESRTVQ